MNKTAILVDGGFYRKCSFDKWGRLKASDAVAKLFQLIDLHLEYESLSDLYRIFYYDCPPSTKKIYNPITGKTIDLSKASLSSWTNIFYEELNKRRKVALRLGNINDSHAEYTFTPSFVKELLNGVRDIKSITDNDLQLVNLTQKGVDMRIGLDIASMAHKGQVNQMVLISGDSDFIPVIKYARREGIDFILDSMGGYINDELFNNLDAHLNLSKSIV